VASSRIIEALGPRPDPQRVEAFWRDVAADTPLIEPAGDGYETVTFCWRDAEAEQVLLFVNRIADGAHLEDSLMRRIDGSDIWTLSYRMRSDWRASYAFVPAYRGERPGWIDERGAVAVRQALLHGRADPRNEATCRNRLGRTQSVASLSEAPSQSWLETRPGVPRGEVEEIAGPDGRTVWSYRSPGVAGPAALLIVFDGDVWIRHQDLPTTLDNLRDDDLIPPVRALLIDSPERADRLDEVASGALDDWMIDRLIGWARERWTVDPDRTVVAGQSLGGLAALRVGLRRPDLAVVIAQSASLWVDDLADLTRTEWARPPRVHLEVGRYEWLLTEPHRKLAERLTSAGAEVHEVEFAGGHDYACWRGGIAEALIWAFQSAPQR